METDFVMNAALLIASSFIIGQIFRKYPYLHTSSVPTRMLTGVCYGIQGIILMLYTIHFNSVAIFDLRHLSIIIAALHGGLPGALVCAVIIALSRIGMFGLSVASVNAAVCMVLIGIGCGLLIRKIKPNRLRLPLLNAACLLVISITAGINTVHAGQSGDKLTPFLIVYWIAALFFGQLAYYLYQYTTRMNRYYFKLKESEQRYRSLIEKSPDATFVHDSDTILFVNDKGLRLLNAAAPKEVTGRSLQEFIHPMYQQEAFQQIKEHQDGNAESKRFEQKYIRLDGVEIDVEVSISSIEYMEQQAFVTTVRDITDRKLTEQKLQRAMAALKRLSDLDGLTGIANRRTFDAFLEHSWRNALEEDAPLSLILLDADEFKAYNDTYGHQAGDDCLRRVAQLAEHLLGGTRHLAARYGGEEFAIVLVHTDAEAARHIGEQLRSGIGALAIPHRSSKVSGIVTASLGVSTVKPSAAAEPGELIRQADSALYRAKIEGRNRVAVYAAESGEHVGF